MTLVCALGADPAGAARRARCSTRAGVRVCDLGAARRDAREGRASAPAGGRCCGSTRGGEAAPLRAAHRRGARGDRRGRRGAGLRLRARRRRASRPCAPRCGARHGAPVVWDPHPRGAEPVPGCVLVTPNAAEAAGFAAAGRDGAGGLAAARGRRAGAARRAGGRSHVCVTRGDRGALLVGASGPALAMPAPPVPAGDPCGAGDCFAATAAGPARRRRRCPPRRCAPRSRPPRRSSPRAAPRAGRPPAPRPRAPAAGRASRWPSACGPPAARWSPPAAASTCCTPATSHALEAARALGDCLVVCLNSDASVRRLKGPDRPLTGEADRAAVLAALRAASTPSRCSTRTTRAPCCAGCGPHVWAKGGDYAVARPARGGHARRWGGRAVVVPYVAGRSTTRLIAGGRRPCRMTPCGHRARSPAGRRGLGAAVAAAVEQEGGTPVVLDRQAPAERLRLRTRSTWPTRARRRRPSAPSSPSEPAACDAVVTAAGTDACGDILDVDARGLGPRDRRQPARHGRRRARRAAARSSARTARVVTVASTLGLRALPAATAYCASKFGVVGFTRALADRAGRPRRRDPARAGRDAHRTSSTTAPSSTSRRPDQQLNDPADVAPHASCSRCASPPGCELRELVVVPADRAVVAVAGPVLLAYRRARARATC